MCGRNRLVIVIITTAVIRSEIWDEVSYDWYSHQIPGPIISVTSFDFSGKGPVTNCNCPTAECPFTTEKATAAGGAR